MPEPAVITMPDRSTAQMRPLSMGIEQTIAAAIPMPRIPMVKDPAKGSNAPLIEDESDPAYRAGFTACIYSRMLAKIAVAIDLPVDGDGYGQADDPKKWITQVVSILLGKVSREWVDYASDELRKLALPEMIAGAGSGNSSTPQATAGS